MCVCLNYLNAYEALWHGLVVCVRSQSLAKLTLLICALDICRHTRLGKLDNYMTPSPNAFADNIEKGCVMWRLMSKVCAEALLQSATNMWSEPK